MGAAVRARRLELGLSQEELGYRARLDRSYLSGVERGVRNATATSLRRIAAALETQVGRLAMAAEGLVESAGSDN